MEPEKAFKRLLIKSPFYGLFCMSLPKVVTTKVNTLAVSKNGISCQLNINPDFWNTLTDDQQIALLQHELGHIAFQHMFMSESFADQKLFNVCADCEVNSYIENLPDDGCTAANLNKLFGLSLENGMGTKRYYEEIQKAQQQQQAQANNPQKPCNGGLCSGNQSNSITSNSSGSQGQSPQSSSSSSDAIDSNSHKYDNQKEETPPSPSQEKQQSQPSQQEEEQPQKEQEKESQYPKEYEETFNQYDDHSTWKEFDNASEATKQLMQNNINSVLKSTAEQVEKMRGTVPGEFQELISKLREKKPEVFNWKAYFRRLLGSIYDVNIKSTRRKVSRRFEDAAGVQHKKKVSILVAIDTSGSVSEEELKDFFSEIDYVYKAGARVTLIQCDTCITDIEEYNGKNIPSIKGRGGTDFNPPVDYYMKHKKEYASLIYFTDGEAPIPNNTPQGLVWVISSCGLHQDYPGKTIYIPKQIN